MKKIELTKGQYALVDDKDFKVLSQHKWHCSFYGYAARRDSGKIVYMHSVILPAQEGMRVDHINRNSLDNRRENLRVCTHRQNLWNRPKSENNTSGFKGVSWEKRRNKWRASICKNYKQYSLGEFFTKEEAALA